MPEQTSINQALVVATILTLFCAFAASAGERPNIVFILSDDHAVRAVSAYDNGVVETPNIDRIAAGGMPAPVADFWQYRIGRASGRSHHTEQEVGFELAVLRWDPE